MATCNFSTKHNATYIFAFCEHGDFEKYVEENKEILDIETEEELEKANFENEYLYSDWYDQEKEDRLNWLEEELDKAVSAKKGLYSDFTESQANHITDGDEVATVRKYITFAGAEFMVMVSIDFEAGYYEGFTLDWNVKQVEGTFGGYDFDQIPDADDCAYLLAENTDLNEGLQKALASKLQARLEAALDEVTDAIETALKSVSPYHLTGFCLGNGEGIYTNHKSDNAA